MFTRRHWRGLVAALSLATAIPLSQAGTAAAAGSYQLRPISDPADPTFTQLLGINNQKAIAGYFGSGMVVSGTLHPNKGFVLTLPNTFTPENYPSSAQTQVTGIDARGDTVGFYVDQAGTNHGFLDTNGAFVTADLPGTTFNQLLGLNNRGQAAGFFQDANGEPHGYVREVDGSDLVVPIPVSTATGINDLGQVVGFTATAGFEWRNGQLTTLSFPGATNTQALGINNLGEVVGDYTDAAGTMHGFVYQHGTFQTVDAHGATATTINGLNDQGDIVGFFVDANNNTIGLLGVPQF